MLESPLWISPSFQTFHGHLALDVNQSFEHKNLVFCQSLEPFCRVLSFDRVTTFSYKEGVWVSDTENSNFPWHEVALKIIIWAVAWVFIIPGIIFTTLKAVYLDNVKDLTKNSVIDNLQNRLNTARENRDIEKIAMTKLDIVAETLRGVSDSQRVVIGDDTRYFYVSTDHDFMQSYLPDAIVAHIDSEERQEENRVTINFLFQHFGEERTVRLFKMMGVDITYRYQHGLGLTRKHIVTFFALTGFVHIKDMRDLWENLHHSKEFYTGYLHLSSERVEEVVNKLGDRPFDDLDKEQYDLLWEIMTPLHLSTMFIDKQEGLKGDQNRGCELSSIIKALWIEQHHMHLHPDMSQRDCDYTLIKSLIGSFTEENFVSIKGKVIRQKKGYGIVRPMIAAGGCYCIPIEAMGRTRRENKLDDLNSEGKQREDTYLSRLLLLPTQTFANYLPNSWESTVGIFQKNLGARGVLAIWPRIQALFRRESFKRVDIIGYSQGGTQAAKLATLALHGGHVRKLTKVCAPAEDASTSELFAEIVRLKASSTNETDYAIKISSIFHTGDRTHMAGDKELATDAVRDDLRRQIPLVKQKIHWFSSLEEDQLLEGRTPSKPEAPRSPMGVMWEAFQALATAHGEDLTLDPTRVIHSQSTINNREAVIDQLDNEPYRWEPVRKYWAEWLDRATPSSYFADEARKRLHLDQAV